MNKYEDMAYMNERGISWFKALYASTMWPKWVERANRLMSGLKVEGTPEQYAQRIVLEAIWHRGYAQDINDSRTMARCARRLRKPPDRGAGADKRGFCTSAVDLNVQAVPVEFMVFDEFLENIVKPTL